MHVAAGDISHVNFDETFLMARLREQTASHNFMEFFKFNLDSSCIKL